MDQKFLQEDLARRFKEARAKEAALKVEADTKRGKIIKDQEKIANAKRRWMSFYDDHGFNKLMYFVWNFDHEYFLTPVDVENPDYRHYKYNYVWSSPQYPDGTNTIWPYYGSIKDYFGSSFGRDKGRHIVRDICGQKTKFVAELYSKSN